MTKDLFQLSSYRFDFDPSLIAQYPMSPRDHSRLMIVDRSTGKITEKKFKDIIELLSSDDTLIFNNTKVIPARLNGSRESGGSAEIFLVKPLGNDHWEVLAKPGKKLKVGSKVYFDDNFSCEITEINDDGSRIATFNYTGDFDEHLNRCGKVPLPQYIKRNPEKSVDHHSYQTVYAKHEGAVAAPTAGLHFTSELLENLRQKKVSQQHVTLHVGLGTFKPVQVDDVREHKMHSERCIIDQQTATNLNDRKKRGRQICVGTTTCRVLESTSSLNGTLTPGTFDTDIFIYPGYQFKYVDALLTNFHLPESTLMMLISAFAGYELIMEAYERAVKEKYRFFSYGDAMLIL